VKILFLSYPFIPGSFGGELIVSIERFESLIQRGHIVEVITSGIKESSEQPYQGSLKILRSPYVHHSKFGRGLRRLVFPWWAGMQLFRSRPDLLHLGSVGGIDPITNMIGSLFVLSAAKLTGAKTVWVHSLADSEENAFTNEGFANWCRSIWLGIIDRIVSVSPALEKDVKIFFPVKSIEIVCGIRDDLFQLNSEGSRSNLRVTNNVEPENIVLVFLGSITKRKGFDILARAFEKLVRDNPELRLWVIGPISNSENQNINNHEVQEITSPLLALKEKVTYFGKVIDRPRLAKILNAGDIFVFPSIREGFGIAPGEAMACGLPVVISKIPGVTDLMVVEGETGLFCEPGDTEGLTTAIRKLILDPGLRKRMGAEGRKRIVERFGWDKHIDDWENLYLTLARKVE